ncbi:MAG: nucleotidyltransferase [Actinomycetota bacterium]|nr:nucleotidyltransferase [Actinomycetota bacterium]
MATFDPEALLRSLTDAGVRFVVIGGIAVGVHGVVRGTKDVDIVPDPGHDNLARLAAALRALEARQIGVDTELLPNQPTEAEGLAQGGSFQLETQLGQLDILQESDAIPAFGDLDRDAIDVNYMGLALRVCSLAHLRQMKRAAGRPRDLRDLEDLDLAHGD